jgi:hypothetical protein
VTGVGSLDWLAQPGAWPTATRQASAENPSGGQGAGCLRVPDPDDPDLPYSAPAARLGPGFKVRPYVPLPAGQTLTLAEIKGSGAITHLYLTSDLADLGQLRLRCWWDGDPEPSVDVPVDDFFGIGHPGRAHELHSLPVVVGPGRGCSCWWPMPFQRHALVTLTNTGPGDACVVAYRVTWNLGGAGERARFHAAHRRSRTSPEAPDHVIVEAAGPGLYVGTTLAWTANQPGWWGEGEVKFYLDGDTSHPTIVDNGTEDHFGGAWGFGRDDPAGAGPRMERPFCSPYVGCPLVETDESTPRHISLYRWHLADPVAFSTDLKVTVQALGWGPDGRYMVRSDDISSAAFWYQGRTRDVG